MYALQCGNADKRVFQCILNHDHGGVGYSITVFNFAQSFHHIRTIKQLSEKILKVNPNYSGIMKRYLEAEEKEKIETNVLL